MKIKHWAGYGCVTARKVKDNDPRTLHVRVEGDHEWGLVRDDPYDMYNWLVKRFDKNVQDYTTWIRSSPIIDVRPGWRKDIDRGYVETCDYYFTY